MKLFTALAVTALLGSSAAFAQTTATAPTNAAPTTSMTPANGMPTTAACKKQAQEKKIAAADKKQFMKDCKAGKSTS
jgi:hypothetical protein